MAQSKKPRKAYRPRAINKTAHVMAMLGAAWLDDAEIKHRTGLLRAAVDAACQGAGTPEHWKVIFDCVNILDAMGQLRLATVTGIHDIMRVIEIALDRRKATGTGALRAEERQALRDLCDAFCAAIPHLTNGDLLRAEELVAATVRRALAGWVPPGTVIVDAVDAVEEVAAC